MPVNSKDFLTVESIHKINATLQSVRIAFGAVIYFDGNGGEKERQTIQYMVDEFIRLFGNDFNSFCIDGTNHEWNGKSLKRGLTTLRKKLSRSGVYQEYTFHFAREDAYNTPNEFGIFCYTQNTTYSMKSVCGFILPMDVWTTKKTEAEHFCITLCNELSADQAHSGITIVDRAYYYFDGKVNWDEERKTEVRGLLTKYFTLDLLQSDITKFTWLFKDSRLWGLRWPSQMNFIGKSWIKKLGDFEKIKKACSSSNLQQLEAGIYIATKNSLSYSSNDYVEALQQIATITAAYRLKQDEEIPCTLFKHLFDIEESIKFISRFDS